MSIPAGIDYTSEKLFAERYPAMLKYGLRRCYDCFSFEGFKDERLNWGYMCEHGSYSTSFIPTAPKYSTHYTTLLNLVADKPYFVASSNADGLFARTGFDKERIWTPQGSYEVLQCKAGCGHVFSSLPVIERVRAATPKETLILDTDKCPIPTCPNCGGKCGFNLNGGNYYINKHWEKDRRNLQEFISKLLDSGKKLAIIEVGISVYNTPIVIRYPMEQLLSTSKQVSMVRINPDHRTNGLSARYGAGVEPERFVPLAMSVDVAIESIAGALANEEGVASDVATRIR